ncbi:MAG: beta-N-acetylhexosaminidase [Pelagimonas sp.]|jgi:beta-N-acetylhexosaminidase|nr:beta-N-acetylhexosaminidase [Pelagimonas sp.]
MSRFGACILGCEGLRLTRQEKHHFSRTSPFGFILFNRNLDSADQIRALTAELRDAVGWNAPVFIDQEGGRVQRLRPPLARDWLPPLDDVARFGAAAPQAMRLRAQIIAMELRGLGIDGNCAPLLDIAREGTHPVLKNRCYGTDLETVTTVARAVAEGCFAGGVLPVMKHIPGHGLGTLDSHLEVPRVAETKEALQALDFAAFRALNDLPLGMTGHLIFEAITDQPATISKVMITLIRQEIGFDGLLMTDDLSMEALSGTVFERAKGAIEAGCDVILHCNGRFDEIQRVTDAAGQMTQPAQDRAQAALNRRTDLPDVDIGALEAEFQGLIPGAPDERN